MVGEASEESAREICRILWGLAHPRSVIDLGSGSGVWLAEFKRLGTVNVLGVDWFDPASVPLRIPAQDYRQEDLSKPLSSDQKYDMAISLEVGEHLPEAAASGYVDSLTRLSDIIIFSAAIPLQLGYGHINERWPAYWARLFRERGFNPDDRLRLSLWNNPVVDYWYSQNLIVYLRRQSPSARQFDAALSSLVVPAVLPLVHPALYVERSAGVDGPIHRFLVRVISRFPRLWTRLARRRHNRTRSNWNPHREEASLPTEQGNQ